MAKADQFYLAAETIATTIEGQDIADYRTGVPFRC